MKNRVLKILTLLELVLATIVIAFDLFIPTLVVLLMICLSLILRKQSPISLGFKKEELCWQMGLKIFFLSIAWTIFTLGLTIPVLMRLTGQQQDLSQFLSLKGNLGQLAIFLAFTWTLAAIGEEVVYRGYLQQKVIAIFGSSTIAILFSSMLFGIAHTEQGLIGVIITFIDAIFFSLIRKHFKNNLWAAVLAHGFNNTIGMIGFFFLGPIYSLW